MFVLSIEDEFEVENRDFIPVFRLFYYILLFYRRSRALSYHYSDKTCETFAKANVSGVKLQKLFVRITVDFTLYGDVRAIKDFCQVAVGN